MASKTTSTAIVLLTTFAVFSFDGESANAQTDTSPQSDGRPDVVIADFEGDSYGQWKTTGDAFGKRPALANVHPRNRVTGHQGRGLVNTYLDGDTSTGTLTSPPFTIQRRHINFLIGAGNYSEATCINLLVDGKVQRTAAGPALKVEGKELLDWQSWDVSQWIGEEAMIQVVDRATGGWGHINIDQIVQSDSPRKPATPNTGPDHTG